MAVGSADCGQHSNADPEYFTERIAETRDSRFSPAKVTKSSPRTCLCNGTESSAEWAGEAGAILAARWS
jgi:hypothetical protein